MSSMMPSVITAIQGLHILGSHLGALLCKQITLIVIEQSYYGQRLQMYDTHITYSQQNCKHRVANGWDSFSDSATPCVFAILQCLKVRHFFNLRDLINLALSCLTN